ncbi:acyltransferase [Pedobacter aquatilis]|uniref:acyltransferase n=1 Tax=Pedobacter aquatilis TaxID=351343 RepID=UPI00292D8C53|nr:DapH/DapD/GlmU-related protein [Pedobacter aquatilis]
MIFYLRVKNSLFIRFFRFFYKTKFKKFGVNSSILFPLNINGLKNISIGNNVCIDNKVWLAAVAHTGSEQCELIIGDGTCIGNFNHIYATRSIILGRNVLTADKVYISDNLHGYEDITMPILKQPIKQIGAVEIGDGTWLGENVCVIGAKIGKNCVIGANSVVTKDIPDYCVAVGAPAKIIKEYCFERKEWIKKN